MKKSKVLRIQTQNKKRKIRRRIQTQNKKRKIRRRIQTQKGGWPDWFKSPYKNKIYIDDVVVEEPVELEHIKLIEHPPQLVEDPQKKKIEIIKSDLFDFAMQNQRPPQRQQRQQRQQRPPQRQQIDEPYYKNVIRVLRSNNLNITKTDEELEEDLHRIVFKFDENDRINEINFKPLLDPSKTIIVYSPNDILFDNHIKNMVEDDNLVQLLCYIYSYYAIYDVGGLYHYFETTELSKQTNNRDTIRESVYDGLTISYTDFFIESVKCIKTVKCSKPVKYNKQKGANSYKPPFLEIIRQFEDDPNDQHFIEIIKVFYPSHFRLL